MRVSISTVHAVDDEPNDHGNKNQPQASEGRVAQNDPPLPSAILVPPAGSLLTSLTSCHIACFLYIENAVHAW